MEEVLKDEIKRGGREKMVEKYRVRVDGIDYFVEVEKIGGEERPGGTGRADEKSGGKRTSIKEREPYGKFETITTREKSILAPMPAKIIKVNCKAGERVRKGDLLMVLEAMKMENEILSPADGVVKEVRVAEGATVSHDETLMVFE